MRLHTTLLLVLAFLGHSAHADHYAGGTISTLCVGNNFHEVTLQLFRDCSGTVLTPQILSFQNSCGVEFLQSNLQPTSFEDASALCAAELPNSTCNGGALIGYQLVTYKTTVYLSPCAEWVISWSICCRGYSINLLGGPGLYIETTLNNSGGACNASPVFVNNIVPTVCIGQPVMQDMSALQDQDHTLTYSLVDARFGSPAPLPVQYANGYSGSEPFTGMSIDAQSGMLTFTPTIQGTIIVVVKISQTTGSGALVGTIMRDMLFHVTACSNQPPTADSGVFNSVTGSAIISGPRQLEICGTEPFCGSLSVVDPNTEQQVFISSNIATALPGATLQMSGTNPVELQLCWTNPIIGSHSFTITATDDACPFSGTRVHAYTINVGVAPYAGENASLSVCENASPFNMIDSLGGVPAPGGQWLDPDGQLSNGIFSPGSSVAGLHTYTVGFEECTSTAVLSVVLQSSEAPECLNVGIPLNRWINLQLVPDPVINSRFLLTGTTMDALISVLSSDGRLITTQRMQLHRDAPAVIEIPRHHHGLAIVRVQGLANGAHFASRVMVP